VMRSWPLLLVWCASATALIVGKSCHFRCGFQRAAVVAHEDVASRIDQTIGEILDEQDDTLPSLLGRRLEVLTHPRFLPRVEERRAAAPDGRREQLEHVGEVVVTFLEELTAQVSQLEPRLEAEEKAAQALQAKAAAAMKQSKGEKPTRRRADAAQTGAPRRASAPSPQQMAPDEAATEALKREKRAQYRYLVERLLDAAHAGTERLDALLREERGTLDKGFFDHLQWEVEQQKAQKNRRMLDILEVIVQRACIEVEEGRSEVALLSALLQTRSPTARGEMYARELAPASPRVQVAFAQLVRETQLELEKAVLRGERVDADLLQMLRIISAEAGDYMALP